MRHFFASLLFVALSITGYSQLFLSQVPNLDSDYAAIKAAYQSAGAAFTNREIIAENNLVVQWKASGAWAKRDIILVEYDGVIINWKSPSSTITKMNSPPSVRYQGLYWNGTNQYVKTNYNPATNGVNYTLNSASISVYLSRPSDPIVTGSIEVGCSTTPLAQINANTSASFFIINSGAGSSFTIPPSERWGWFTVDRNASNSVKSYRFSTEINSQTTTSTSIPNAEMFWGARSNSGTAAGFSTAITKIMSAGGSIRAELAAESQAIQNYIEASKPALEFSAPFTTKIDGQSNAFGLASILELPSDLVPNIATNFEFYGNPQSTQFTDGAWDVSKVGIYSTQGVGVDRRLFRLLSDHYGTDLYTLNSGQNGTSLQASWAKGGSGSAYLNAKIKYDYGIAKLPEVAPTQFVIWIQGEADASGGVGMYGQYEERLTDLIFRYRADYNLPNLTIILVSLSSTQTVVDATGRAAVNAAMQACANNIPNVYYINQNSLSDGTHYTCAGYDQIAPLIYNIIISLVP